MTIRKLGRQEADWLGGALGFHSMPDRPALLELLAKLPSLSLVDYEDGVPIVREGELSDDFYVLYKGTAVVEKGGRRVAELAPGDFFGEVGFLVHVPRTATVKAGHGCQAFRFPGAEFERIVSRVSGLEAMLRDVAQQRMRKLAGSEAEGKAKKKGKRA